MQMVILAAGLGKRYGGLKQYEPVDDDGNFLIDYSIYDAILCGYSKVIIVIQKSHLKFFEALKARIGARIPLEFVHFYALVTGEFYAFGFQGFVLLFEKSGPAQRSIFEHHAMPRQMPTVFIV